MDIAQRRNVLMALEKLRTHAGSQRNKINPDENLLGPDLLKFEKAQYAKYCTLLSAAKKQIQGLKRKEQEDGEFLGAVEIRCLSWYEESISSEHLFLLLKDIQAKIHTPDDFLNMLYKQRRLCWDKASKGLDQAYNELDRKGWAPNGGSPQQSESGCFIAISVYGGIKDYRIHELRYFRDRYLLKSRLGNNFVLNYYQISPNVARKIGENKLIKSTFLFFLCPIVSFVVLLNKSTLR